MSPWPLLASGAGIGYAPKAPGTFGSFAGLMLGWALLSGGHGLLLLGVAVVTLLGLYAIGQLPHAAHDPGWIVIDEIAGQMLAMLALPHPSFIGLVLCFALFRLFDILKPGPVAWADRRDDEFGIMGDDLIAGLLAALVIWLLRLVWPL